MDPVVVASNYRPEKGCGCFPHQLIDSAPKVANMAVCSSQMPPVCSSGDQSNSNILHSILSKSSTRTQPPVRQHQISPHVGAGVHRGVPRLPVHPGLPMAGLGIPTPPPSEPGSPNQPMHHSPRGGSPLFYQQNSPNQLNHGKRSQIVNSVSQDPQTSSLAISQYGSPRRLAPPPLIHISALSNDSIRRPSNEATMEVRRHSASPTSPLAYSSNSQGLKRKTYSASELPMDLSFPKRSKSEPSFSPRRTNSPDPFCLARPRQQYVPGTGITDHNGTSVDVSEEGGILKSILCGRLRSGPATSIDENDSSTPVPKFSTSHGLVRSPQERIADMIRRAKARKQRHDPSPKNLPQNVKPLLPLQQISGLVLPSKPAPDGQEVQEWVTSPPIFTNQETVVQLAKKNLLPVSARVSDWIFKMIHFCKTLQEFVSLAHNDQVTLVLNSWPRLLLLHMAETNFQFAVTPLGVCRTQPSPPEKPSSVTPPPTQEEPTVRSVDEIQGFIKKYQTIQASAEEISYLRLLTLFNPSYISIEQPAFVENINAYVRRSFQDHCIKVATGSGKSAITGKLRYSQLLLTLPMCFGISPKIMESLFCRNISSETDLEVLLKEMLKKI